MATSNHASPLSTSLSTDVGKYYRQEMFDNRRQRSITPDSIDSDFGSLDDIGKLSLSSQCGNDDLSPPQRRVSRPSPPKQQQQQQQQQQWIHHRNKHPAPMQSSSNRNQLSTLSAGNDGDNLSPMVCPGTPSGSKSHHCRSPYPRGIAGNHHHGSMISKSSSSTSSSLSTHYSQPASSMSFDQSRPRVEYQRQQTFVEPGIAAAAMLNNGSGNVSPCSTNAHHSRRRNQRNRVKERGVADSSSDSDDIDADTMQFYQIGKPPHNSLRRRNLTRHPVDRSNTRRCKIIRPPTGVTRYPMTNQCTPVIELHSQYSQINNHEDIDEDDVDSAFSISPTRSIDAQNNIDDDEFKRKSFVRCSYLGSTRCQTLRTTATDTAKISQAQEAIAQIKVANDVHQPACTVDIHLTLSSLLVYDSFTNKALMDFPLNVISFAADVGDLLIVMTERSAAYQISTPSAPCSKRPDAGSMNDCSHDFADSLSPKMNSTCHVFRSGNARIIGMSISEAFDRAYQRLLKQRMDIGHAKQRTKNLLAKSPAEEIVSEFIFHDETYSTAKLCHHAKTPNQRSSVIADTNKSKERRKSFQTEQVVIPKRAMEKVGFSLIETGWGSPIPAFMIASMIMGSPAQNSGKLNVGDFVLSVNGISMVGLSNDQCVNNLKSTRSSTSVHLVIMRCNPVVNVFVRRSDPRHHLGFNIQDGIVCSLLRGGIAERAGIRVGHRLIELNGRSLVSFSHERIVSMISNAVGELRMRTVSSKLFDIMTGKEIGKFF